MKRVAAAALLLCPLVYAMHGDGDKEALALLALVGLPIAGGVLGYQVQPRTTQDVIYRAPTPNP